MDDGTFKVGEIGILQNLTGVASFLNGQEVEVVHGIGQRNVLCISGAVEFLVTYIISYRGNIVAVCPSNLKKKRPPRIFHATPRELEAA
jgi:hypothetical protein